VRSRWFVLSLGAVAVFLSLTGCSKERTPWDGIAEIPAHVDHSTFFEGAKFTDGPSVTKACMECHEKEARDFLKTTHWTWQGDSVRLPDGTIEHIGKANLINNFCIGIKSNEKHCTTCHAGYGWRDDSFDFNDPTRIDCLICHDNTGTYQKAEDGAGEVDPDVDLLAVAKGVGAPTRQNCGFCHFRGGGGDAVKHGDLDGSMYFPTERIDVHMGRYDFQCYYCHRTVDHDIKGRSMTLNVSDENRIACTDCHDSRPHKLQRLNEHTDAVACETCHIPEMAIDEATKMSWDWSQAGQDLPIKDHHVYAKTKGRFVFKKHVIPEYYWYNGHSGRYLMGEKINPDEVLKLDWPLGGYHDGRAKIWPFKVHRGKQPYDTVNKIVLVPNTVGPQGYWTIFDWDTALRIGSEHNHLPYSGHYGWISTEMYWPLAHMVQPKEKAVQCDECHSPGGRMDWKALGYRGDPAFEGGRRENGAISMNVKENPDASVIPSGEPADAFEDRQEGGK